jgi:hypothetical protein
MKWIAKRILLQSYENMDKALIKVVIPFVKQIINENSINNWYCSRKTEQDVSKPSIRVYIKIEENQESEILQKLDLIVQDNKDIIGWTGHYNQPDPSPPELSKRNLDQIQKACEIALNLMQLFPDSYRSRNLQFLKCLKEKLYEFLDSMGTNYDIEAIHFIANNLGIRDDDFKDLLQEYSKTNKNRDQV